MQSQSSSDELITCVPESRYAPRRLCPKINVEYNVQSFGMERHPVFSGQVRKKQSPDACGPAFQREADLSWSWL
jgi:hypothetical protein